MNLGNPIPVAPTFYPCGLPEMDENLLACSIGSLLSREELAEILDNPIRCEPEERSLLPQVRKAAAHRLRNIFISTPTTLDVAENIQRLMKVGYLHRDPHDEAVDAWRNLTVNQLRILGKEKKISASKCGMKIPGVAPFRSAPLCMGNFGLPGTGKTGLHDRIFNTLYFNRVVIFPDINGVEHRMIRWLYLHVSRDASSKWMITELVRQVGILAGEDFNEVLEKNNGRHIEDFVLPDLVNLIQLFHVGAIIIDEIELIKAAYSRGDMGLKNLWLLLMNTCRVPLILIGNPDARSLFEDEFKLQHRLCSAGSTIFDKLPNVEDGEFRFFAEKLFPNQFTKKPTDMTPEIMAALHECSGGLIKVLIELMIFVQIHVIGRSRDEQITPQAIREAARKNSASIQRTIKGLNSGHEDGLPADVQMKVLRSLAIPKLTTVQPPEQAPATGVGAAAAATPKLAVVKKLKSKAGKAGQTLQVGERKADCLADYALKEVKGDLTSYDMLLRDGFIALDFAAPAGRVA
jgi:hypothetical protein